MKAFHFPLQTVMNWHGQTAERERAELERLHGVKQEVARRQEQLRLEVEGLQLRIGGGVSAHELAQAAEYARRLHIRRAEMKHQEEQWDKQIESQRVKCIESKRKFRLLEICRERRLGEWERALDSENEQTATSSYLARWVREAK